MTTLTAVLTRIERAGAIEGKHTSAAPGFRS
jgi:hypothetical protein